MRKNFILDTNVLLYNPNSLFGFADNTVVIPIEVIEELDGFKRDITDLGQNARTVALSLDRLRRRGSLGEGVPLDGGGLLRVYASDSTGRGYRGPRTKHADARILELAIQLNQEDPEVPAIIITKSINLRLRADALGIYAEDYEEPLFSGDEPYQGWREVAVPVALVEELTTTGKLTLPDLGVRLLPNEYVVLKAADNPKAKALGRVAHGQRREVVAIPLPSENGVLGIRPLNLAQTFALDALLNDQIKLVTLLGKAGTGKTLLAVAAGLYKVFGEDRYNRLLVSRPTLPMGRDIGFIPGDIEEKMRPWMQPIYDAIELIRELDRRSAQRSLPPNVLESEEVGIEPLTYIRGRSIPHQFMIIDEAQNLTPLEVKTIITRVGVNTKIVLTGDPQQIDNPYVDAVSNGLVFLVNRFRPEAIAAHVTLSKGERSDLAELAANLL